jgi:hypothetical protein
MICILAYRAPQGTDKALLECCDLAESELKNKICYILMELKNVPSQNEALCKQFLLNSLYMQHMCSQHLD